MNVYEIKGRLALFLDYLCGFAEIEDLPEDIAAKLDGTAEAEEALLQELESDKAAKLEACLAAYKNQKALAESIKAEKMALAKRQSAAENAQERIKALVKFLLTNENGELQKYVSAKHQVTFRSSEETDVSKCDLSKLPAEFVKVEISAKKAELKQAIKAGQVFEGVEIVKKQNLQIK